MNIRAFACVVALGLIAVPVATATPVTFSASDGAGRAATATFDLVSCVALTCNLQIVLSNTGAAFSSGTPPTFVLTALFFNLTDNPLLGRLSALMSGGSTIANPGAPGCLPPAMGCDNPPANALDVGGEWGYLNSLAAGAPLGANSGLSSAGFGPLPVSFGPSSRFNTNNREGEAAPDGVNYGLVPASYVNGQGNAAVSGNPLVRHQVTFLLSGISSSFDLGTITRVSFQYGTALSEPNIVPEPSSYLAITMAMAIPAFLLYRRQRLNQQA